MTDRTDRTLARSDALVARALRVVAGQTSTNSKRTLAFAANGYPAYAERAQGCRVVDVDGNCYVDWVAALAPIILGYCDTRVDDAVRNQLGCGVLFSLPPAVEVEVAELLVTVVPTVELVRFFKTGAEALSAAVRLSRQRTGRDVVLCSGYHGWHDWFAATRWPDGVPTAVAELTNAFPLDDLDAARGLAARNCGRLACIVVTPAAYGYAPAPGFLEGLRNLADETGAILVFDEIITGFRWALGGAQSVYGVTPDLSVFGKAMANGYPLAAIAGRRDIMNAVEMTWITSTYASEALSLVAARTTIEILRDTDAIAQLYRTAERLTCGIAELAARRGVAATISDPLPGLRFGFDAPLDAQARLDDVFVAGCAARGVLIRRDPPGFSLCTMVAHDDGAIAETLSAFDAALADAMATI